MRSFRRIGLLAGVLLLVPVLAQAQTYPDKPVRLIVPFPPGGGVDAVGRAFAQSVPKLLGQQVVVDNRGGSGSIIGADAAARSAPDGYTLLFGGTATHGITPHLYKTLPYDPVKSFEPISSIGATPLILAVHPSVGASNIHELIEAARAKPGQLNYASPGSGSAIHLASELFKATAKIDIVHVPYKGVGAALTDLLSGRMQMMLSTAEIMLPHIRSGALTAIGVTDNKRLPAAPDLPTISESGLAGFQALTWYGVLAPSGTPAAIVSRLNQVISDLLKDKEFLGRLAALGVQPLGGTPQEFATFIQGELTKWGEAVRVSGAKVD